MRKFLFPRWISSGLFMFLLLAVPVSPVAANTIVITNPSYPGYALTAQTNHPIDFSNPGYYRSASFSDSSDSGVTLEVQNSAGDWCSGGTVTFPKATDGPYYVNNPPNSSVSAMTGWVAYSSCSTGHNYLVQGYHSESSGGVTINNGSTSER